MEEKKNTHTQCFFGICASRCVLRLGQPSLLPNSYSHQITRCALPGTNSSRKVLKHYLGGHKQLDSLESRPIQTSSNRNDEGGGGAGKKNGRKAELCEVHYKVHLTACSRRSLPTGPPLYTVRPPQIYWCRSLNEINRMRG